MKALFSAYFWSGISKTAWPRPSKSRENPAALTDNDG